MADLLVFTSRSLPDGASHNLWADSQAQHHSVQVMFKFLFLRPRPLQLSLRNWVHNGKGMFINSSMLESCTDQIFQDTTLAMHCQYLQQDPLQLFRDLAGAWSFAHLEAFVD
jgi:hypothetical protein